MVLSWLAEIKLLHLAVGLARGLPIPKGSWRIRSISSSWAVVKRRRGTSKRRNRKSLQPLFVRPIWISSAQLEDGITRSLEALKLLTELKSAQDASRLLMVKDEASLTVCLRGAAHRVIRMLDLLVSSGVVRCQLKWYPGWTA